MVLFGIEPWYFLVGCRYNPQFGERVVVAGWIWVPYKLPIVTIGLSLTVFAVLRLVTDRQTDSIGLAKGGTMH